MNSDRKLDPTIFRSNTGNSFAYVYRCNIYFRPSVKSDRVFPITTDGRPGVDGINLFFVNAPFREMSGTVCSWEPSLKFVSKAGAYLSKVHKHWLQALLANIDQGPLLENFYLP